MPADLEAIDPGVPAEALDAAERELGRALPQALRGLLGRANGAYASPEWFVVEWPGPDGDTSELAQLHYLYPLATIVKESHALASRLPSGALAIGQDPGGALILMLTSGDEAGSIRFWRLAYDPYGEGDNADGVGVVAASLEQWLDALEPEPDFG